MNRRDFSKSLLALGVGVTAVVDCHDGQKNIPGDFYLEPAKKLPTRHYDVVVAGGGTAGVAAALAAARNGAKTILIEAKGYPGGTVTEGGTALHSFYNLWKAFPGVEKRQVVKGIPQEIIDRLKIVGGASGHAEMTVGCDYDSVCTCIDTELYKLVAFEMLVEAGVFVAVHTLLVGAIMDGSSLKGLITESRSGREAILATSFIDCTGYGDLCCFAGADYVEPNDYAVCNSFGLANVNVEKLFDYLKSRDAIEQLAYGVRSGVENQIVRIQGQTTRLPEKFHTAARDIGMSMVTTTVHDNYFMFIKINYKMPVSPTDRDAVAAAEIILRQNQLKAVALFRTFIPGCEKAFMARTSPGLNIRRGRLVSCDYDISHDDVIEGRHFNDDVFTYGFHDSAPQLQIKDGGTYGIPYRALCVKGVDNLYACGMMITSDQRAHMSTRNTICCMGQGQAAGTAAAFCAKTESGSREVDYGDLRAVLEKDNVYFEA